MDTVTTFIINSEPVAFVFTLLKYSQEVLNLDHNQVIKVTTFLATPIGLVL